MYSVNPAGLLYVVLQQQVRIKNFYFWIVTVDLSAWKVSNSVAQGESALGNLYLDPLGKSKTGMLPTLPASNTLSGRPQ